jgi:predicted nucleic acid-binding protein
MVLVDSSVWIDHLSKGNGRLVQLLNDGMVMCHPFVIGELACGHLRNREEILGLLAALPQAPLADHDEVLRLIDRHSLFGRRLGWVDVHLLGSSLLAASALWTLDKPLSQAAGELRVAADVERGR